ncbi:MAG: hypothetical protein ACKOFW_12640, partial [Planctomycetaceae bacterium]
MAPETAGSPVAGMFVCLFAEQFELAGAISQIDSRSPEMDQQGLEAARRCRPFSFVQVPRPVNLFRETAVITVKSPTLASKF